MQYVQHSTVCGHGQGHGYAMACIDCNGCPSQKQPTTGSRQGPRQARDGGRRLIWLIQLADLAQAGDHLWSLRPAPYVVQTYTTNAGWVHGSLPFVDFFFLNSHVTRWDRIRPILICSPRIPAPRGEAARPTALKTARVNRAWCSLVPLVPKNRVVKGPSRRALDGHGNLADSRVNTATHDTVAACAMSKHCTAHRSDQIRSD